MGCNSAIIRPPVLVVVIVRARQKDTSDHGVGRKVSSRRKRVSRAINLIAERLGK
jgi:hypothetical protein